MRNGPAVMHIVACNDRAFLDVARAAKADGLGLYITREGDVVTYPHRLPGWQQIAAGLDPDRKEQQRCAA